MKPCLFSHSFGMFLLSLTFTAVVRPAPADWNNIPPGRPGFGATIANLAAPGGKKLQVELSEPVVIAIADKPEGWGYFQFPQLMRLPDDRLQVKWNMSADSITSYGKSSHGAAVSSDGGKTWQVVPRPLENRPELLLPNGDRIAVHTPEALRIEDLDMPPPVAEAVKPSSKEIRRFYRLEALPEVRRGVFITRQKSGDHASAIEHASLEDPRALRHSTKGLVPIVWWGDMQVAPDSSVVIGTYPGFALRTDDSFDRKSGVFFYRSTDAGHSWHVLSRVFYEADLKADPNGNERIGFTEPAFRILPNGNYICVARTADADNGPMYVFTSADGGTTWSRPRPFTSSGVLPRLLNLENGVVVLSSGRPGVQLRFNTDQRGESWSEAVELLPYVDQKRSVSCGYTQLLATGPDRFLVVYSDFCHPGANGELRKAIKIREVVVTVQSN